MVINGSPEFKVVNFFLIICVVEIQSESAWALTNITSGNTCHAKSHASEASGSEEEYFNIFQCISLVQTQDFYFSTGGHFVHRSGTVLAILVEGHPSIFL